LNPESGATQNVEKNAIKNNFFDDNDEDNLKNNFNLFNDKSSQSSQKVVNKVMPVNNKTLPVPATSHKTNVEKKQEPIHKTTVQPVKAHKTVASTHTNQQKDNFASFNSNDPFNFSQNKGDNFENIFDSLASAPKTKIEDKKTNYFDD